MNKRLLIGIIVVIVLAAVASGVYFLLTPKAGEKKVYRVGILSGLDPFAPVADGFKAKMTELGYIEGKNIVYDLQKVHVDETEMRKVIDKFMADKVDLIFAFPTEPAMLAKAATKGTDIPVVFAMGTIEGNDLVESLQQPGGNITGARYCGPDMFIKTLEFLLELAPNVKRIGLIYEPIYPAIPSTLEKLRPAASSLGVTLVEIPIASIADIEAVLGARAKLSDVGLDAILQVPGIIATSPPGWAAISKFAAEHKLPLTGATFFGVEQGAVFSYAPDNIEVGRLVAPLADKIFKGTQAGTISVVTPEARLRLNYKVIQELGLTVPEGLLNRADEIIR